MKAIKNDRQKSYKKDEKNERDGRIKKGSKMKQKLKMEGEWWVEMSRIERSKKLPVVRIERRGKCNMRSPGANSERTVRPEKWQLKLIQENERMLNAGHGKGLENKMVERKEQRMKRKESGKREREKEEWQQFGMQTGNESDGKRKTDTKRQAEVVNREWSEKRKRKRMKRKKMKEKRRERHSKFKNWTQDWRTGMTLMLDEHRKDRMER